MKVCIIGCGAIGSLFGAHLAKLDDIEVWAYDPNQAHVDAINKNGLRLTGLADIVAPVRARSNAAAYGGAAGSVDAHKRRRIVLAARHYLARLVEEPTCRFDVVALEAGKLEWLPGAFSAEE